MKFFFSGKKVPVILNLLFNSAFVTDFQKQSSFFNFFFANQCTLISYNRVILHGQTLDWKTIQLENYIIYTYI